MSMFADVIKQRTQKTDLALESLAAQATPTADAAVTSEGDDDVSVGAPVVPADGGEPMIPTPADATPPAGDPVVEPAAEPAVDAPAIAPESTPATPTEAAPKSDPNDMSATADATPPAAETIALRVRKSPAMFDVAQVYQAFGRLDQTTAALSTQTRNLETVAALKTVLSEQPLSAPLVTALEALPGFAEIAPNFPSSSLFNVIHEPKVSVNQQLGMESLSIGENAVFGSLTASAATVSTTFGAALESIGAVAVTMKAQFEADMVALESSDVTDDVMMHISAVSLSQADMTDLLAQLTTIVQTVTPFNADDMRSHPQNLAAEVIALAEVVGVSGSVLGLKLSDSGLVATDKDARFVASEATLGERGIGRDDLNAFLTQGAALCDQLIAVSEQKESLVTALATESQSIPATLNSDDVTFGAVDHVALMQSYVGLTSAAVRETMNAVALVQGLANAVLDLDGGTTI
jgi:hypothetical protein